MAEHSFTLSGVALPEGEDPLGLWDVPEVGAVSFGVEAAAPPEPTWRIELPESPAQAQAILARKLDDIARAQQDLARASEELALLDPSRPAVSFGTPDRLSSHKEALLATANEIRATEQISFGLPGLPGKLKDQEIYRQWNALMDQIRQVVAHYARIETALAGYDVGLTTVGWTGDFDTTWGPGVATDAMRTHLQAVHLALDSQAALVRVVSVVAAGAAGLAAKTAVSGGVFLLPGVWRFVRDVLKVLRESWPAIQG
jgi:hypothetical protein